MTFNFSLFVTALGLAFVLESLPWLLAPHRMRAAIQRLLELEPEKLRLWGAVLLGSGVGLVALAVKLAEAMR